MTSADDLVLQVLQDQGLLPDAHTQAYKSGLPDNPTEVIRELVAIEALTPDQITEALALAFHMEVVDLQSVSPGPDVLESVPLKTAKQLTVFPVRGDESSLDLAISDPLDMDPVDTISHWVGKPVNALLASREAILEAIHRAYEGAERDEPISSILDDFHGDPEAKDPTSVLERVGALEPSTGGKGANPEVSDEEAPIVRYVQMLITEAIKCRASDIHLEPLEQRFRVRFRVDGVLQEVESPPKRLQASILSRLKIMSNISIAERRIPQDGRISMQIKTKRIDLRVSSLPTAYGESIVMRILDKEGLRLGLPQLGFFSDDQSTFEQLIRMPDGIFLVTGPTGSGKSTTLYSALNFINQPDRKIITVEDPVEYELSGINQVQVKEDVGMTFSAALRSMLRQAPNIIMVGEIRDLETAEIAVNASLTGHMVYSTLHTNDAPSAVSRLVNIGVKPFLVSASLRGVLAQRLVRQIDPDQNEPYTPNPGDCQILGISPGQGGENMKQGVPHVTNGYTGFRGRKGIFELFQVNEDLQQMIYENQSLVAIRQKARASGMRSMREDGYRKVLAGITTLEEVLTVTVEASGISLTPH